MSKLTPNESAAIPSPTQDMTTRCPIDAILREHGWEIAHRRNNQEPIWKKGDRLATQSAAIASLPEHVQRSIRR